MEQVQLQTQDDQAVHLQELELQFKIKQLKIEVKDREEVRKLGMEMLRLVHEEKMKELQFRLRSENETASSHTSYVSPPQFDVGRNKFSSSFL